ncbi:MAG: glycosyltransferase [Chloroflexi bacterium]|nr:MAG: glycosyltransferase [Chloroflexota bacterium]
MISACVWSLGVAVAFGMYTYLGYPMLLGLVGLFRRGRPPVASAGDWPAISIVLPVYNEEAVIRETLENLLRLDYPADRRQILVAAAAEPRREDGCGERGTMAAAR